MTQETIGFIGLGNMGLPIVGHLLDAGYQVNVWGRNQERLNSAIEKGAVVKTSATNLAEASDIVFLCVSDTSAVEQIVFGEDGISKAAAADKVLVDHSTIQPTKSRELANKLESETSMKWIDAPVSGGAIGAKNAALVVMAGGDADALNRVKPIIETYSKQITHTGAQGSGQAVKVCNQIIVGTTLASWAEAFSFAENFGLDPTTLPDTLKGGLADSPILQNQGRRMAAKDYGPMGGATMLKDMKIASEMGVATDTPMPMTAIVTTLYEVMLAKGVLDEKGMFGMRSLYDDTQL